MTEDKLKEFRRRIDVIDDQILDLLNRRARIVVEVGKAKQGARGDFYVPSREKAIYDRLIHDNAGPFPDDGVRRVFREIISASLSLEEPLKVAFLGPQATFTHVATMQQFGQSARLVPQKSIPAVFDEVARGRANYGVVPVENSNEGIVNHTLDMFFESDLKIIAEILLEVSHDLLSISGDLAAVRKVISHPQALAQCREWLEENLPHVSLVDVASTALAAQLVADDESAAAIASEQAGSLYGLKVAKHKIEDNPNNFTRFLVVGRNTPSRSGNDKTSIMFSVKDEAGILYRMLEPFSSRGINLCKIESRPLRKKAWEYIFFLDLEGHIEDVIIREAVEDLRQYCQFLKVLGSYPRVR
ncbi:prephenate dehydratase [Geothermobacter hydrogeniphilus]|uniref:Bifunctional chorismate mutase/prephenate dehydratase n=1 Tax=Geothermobacter hydrogeniphilus TaxID=1969733 RepID=A0A1X0Y8T9_9BACT|nr:prephenate dehydratase [Geothermobacter hydrogeniphilus]ORJ61522.1 chorismate mutase [Geothermobacter hydrogeniphilus]